MRYLFLFLLLTACSGKTLHVKTESMNQSAPDPYLWLEDVEGSQALDFAKAESSKTLQHFQKDPTFAKIQKDLTEIALAEDRLPGITLINGEVYNLWQDKVHVRGVWRKTSLESFQSATPKWETVLDIDALAQRESENWVWKYHSCLPPENRLCLVTLSRGGKDASVIREFDLQKKEFVKGGFELPEAKSSMSWIDANTVFIGTDFGPNSMTDSGYPMISKIWKRGQPLSEAKEVFRGEKKDMSAASSVYFTPQRNYRLHVRVLSFYENEIWYEDSQGKRSLLPLPKSADFSGIFADRFLFILRESLKTETKDLPAGSLVALPLKHLYDSKPLNSLETLFIPQAKRFLSYIAITKSAVYLNLIDNVQGKLAKLTHEGSTWHTENLPLGQTGVAHIYDAHAFDDTYLASYTDFLTPSSIYLGGTPRHGKTWTLLKQAPARFATQDLKVEQREARSSDGTLIPYFIVHKKNLKLDGANPTLMYGYGGFEISIQPWYLESLGKVWVEKGGVFVVANIRGGGEFGPAWHQAVVRENRPKVYDDFVAVAESLIQTKVTSADHLGIQGRSNGGLLTGATFIKRPDLFKAVLCEVPLLDMLRYHKLLAGASWMDEYGNPDDPKMREILKTYSPYQNVKAGVKYPEVLFMTSTKDDRVHPGHARKMVARMKEQGHPVFYYENTEGGHAGNANLQQKILWNSLEFTYLWQKLGAQK